MLSIRKNVSACRPEFLKISEWFTRAVSTLATASRGCNTFGGSERGRVRHHIGFEPLYWYVFNELPKSAWIP